MKLFQQNSGDTGLSSNKSSYRNEHNDANSLGISQDRRMTTQNSYIRKCCMLWGIEWDNCYMESFASQSQTISTLNMEYIQNHSILIENPYYDTGRKWH